VHIDLYYVQSSCIVRAQEPSPKSTSLTNNSCPFLSPSHYCKPLHFPFHCINTKRGILHFCALPARSVSFHEVLTPTLCSDIIYACDYTVLNTQKGYFAINQEIRLFFLPSKPFETGHVESWRYTSMYYILWCITIV